ncbi:hypothetical protein OG601_47060 [Streptomyces sp. NBC_01239]|uniref:hypothetical protein n=1 Tax=Streptomyces sp. NBC_01239 TaxID=2903792 RepID=UPI002254D125|nr:hypothetical protein [Streptomyces sp. NBC_01239]MCX4809048.1 hypothetical protein [Streptomyces sp. NBC_01239]MCX4818135.1 hypothetical protein [Streptomyces sp. NBC_01239]
MTMTTPQLLEALHAHFIKPEDRISQAGAGAVFLTEVTAPNSTRRADAVHLGLWQSRGAGDIDVCELKTSRSDWRRELDNPAKAEAWWAYSSRFWVVAPSTDVVPAEEVPDGWGLMVPGTRGRRFKTVVKPAVREPKLSMGLLLTLLKNTETTRTNTMRQLEHRMQRDSYDREERLRRELATKTDPGVKRRLEHLEELEKNLGIQIGTNSWRQQVEPALVGRAIGDYIRDADAHDRALDGMDYQARDLERLAGRLTEAAAELRAIPAGRQAPTA